MVSLTYDAENSVYDFETSELKGSLRAQSPDPQVDHSAWHKPACAQAEWGLHHSSQVFGAQPLSAVCDSLRVWVNRDCLSGLFALRVTRSS